MTDRRIDAASLSSKKRSLAVGNSKSGADNGLCKFQIGFHTQCVWSQNHLI
jgi:hypothetical protein